MLSKKINPQNMDLHSQISSLQTILFENPILKELLVRSRDLEIKNYYIGAGCIAQTVWNYLTNKPLNHGIQDIDFVYYDQTKLSCEDEERVIGQIQQLFSDIPCKMDVKNQARVHLWYAEHFGYPIEPYSSLEDAINSWPTTATSIGVRLKENGDLIVYAPYGLNDLFGKVVRANKVQITREIYEQKVSRWLSVWDDLIIVPW